MLVGVSCTASARVAVKAATTEKAVTVLIRKRRMVKSPIPFALPPAQSAGRLPGSPGSVAICRGWGERMRKLHCIAAVLLVLAAPADAAQKAHAVAHLKNLEGKPVGTVDFAAVNRGVLVT